MVDLKPETYRGIIAGLVMAIFGVGGVSGLSGWRLDKFGRSDFDLAMDARNERIIIDQQRMREYIDLKTSQQMFEIQQQMPPNATRMRIHALEVCAEKVCSSYTAPSQTFR